MNHSRLLLAGALTLAGALLLAARRIERLEVVGPSMLPVLEPGDRVLVLRRARCRPADLVAIVDPTEPGRVVVKRVAALDPVGGIMVLGDNADFSTDSRHYGLVDTDNLIGVVFYRYAPEGRRGRIGSLSCSERW